jgi:rhodanese-related sulfurtransferase
VIDRMLAEARTRITRYSPAEAAAADDILLVDVRTGDERHATGVIPSSVHVARSVLEWRVDPASGVSNDHVTRSGCRLLLLCDHGWSSSLAAATLVELGVDAGDLDGGFDAWAAAGLPVEPA